MGALRMLVGRVLGAPLPVSASRVHLLSGMYKPLP